MPRRTASESPRRPPPKRESSLPSRSVTPCVGETLDERLKALDARIAAAEATRAEGEANADAIRAKGVAEAEATRLQAEAVAQQSEAFLQLRLVELLPQIAHELAAPMGNIDQLTVVSTDGASQLTKNVANGFTEIDGVLNGTMGVGIKDLLGGLIGGSAAGAAFARGAGTGSASTPRQQKDAEPARAVNEAPRTSGGGRRAETSATTYDAAQAQASVARTAEAAQTSAAQTSAAQASAAQATLAAERAAEQQAAAQQAARAATAMVDATADAAQEAIARRANAALDAAMGNVTDRLRRNG